MDAVVVVASIVGIGTALGGVAVAVATRLASTAADARALIERIEVVSVRVDALGARVAAIEAAAVQHADRDGHERAQLEALDIEVRALRGWASDYRSAKTTLEGVVSAIEDIDARITALGDNARRWR